jgi:glycerol-3-phosphate acyltransferase PlsY
MQTSWIPLLVSYLIGAVPYAFIISKISKGIDPREVGDRNLGAKNVFLSVGIKEGIIVAILDMGKGAAVVLLGKYLGVNIFGQFAMGLMAIIGHNWSIFLKFDGGQGMATTIGVLWTILPVPTSVGIGIGIITHFLTHHWIITAGIGLVLIPIIGWLLYRDVAVSLYATGMLPVIGIRAWIQGLVYQHRKELVDSENT